MYRLVLNPLLCLFLCCSELAEMAAMTTRADGSLRETYGRYSQHVDGAGGSGAYGFGESKAEDSHSTQPQPHATSSQFVVRPSSTADIYSLTRTQPVNYSSPKPPRAVQPHAAGAEVPGGRGGPTAASSVPASASSSSSSSLSSGPQHRHQVPSHGHQPQHHQQSQHRNTTGSLSSSSRSIRTSMATAACMVSSSSSSSRCMSVLACLSAR
jgi:hypothetical protein